MKMIQKYINLIFAMFGLELLKFPNGVLKKRMELLRKFSIEMVLDVGANTGQYADLLRKGGYRGEIISYEPLSQAFKTLSQRIRNDKTWAAENLGLGNYDGDAIINISENSVSSSILNIKKEHVDAAPESSYFTQEKISICKLDSIFEKYDKRGKNIFLKIDTQGFEKEVIQGANLSLAKITGIQVEMSLVELYEGEWLFDKIISLVESYGFKLYSIEPGFSDPVSGKLLQFDGIFFKEY